MHTENMILVFLPCAHQQSEIKHRAIRCRTYTCYNQILLSNKCFDLSPFFTVTQKKTHQSTKPQKCKHYTADKPVAFARLNGVPVLLLALALSYCESKDKVKR